MGGRLFLVWLLKRSSVALFTLWVCVCFADFSSPFIFCLARLCIVHFHFLYLVGTRSFNLNFRNQLLNVLPNWVQYNSNSNSIQNIVLHITHSISPTDRRAPPRLNVGNLLPNPILLLIELLQPRYSHSLGLYPIMLFS